MSGSGITIELDKNSLEATQKALGRLSVAVNDLTPVWDEIGAYFSSELAQNFTNSEAWDGTKWQASERAQKDSEGKTLVDHGHLRDSFTYNASANGFEFGTNVVYAAIHQFGGKAGRNKSVTLPARPMLPDALTAADEFEILNIINKHLERVLD